MQTNPWITFQVMQTNENETIRDYLTHYFLSSSNIYKLELGNGIKKNHQPAKLREFINQGDLLSFDFTSIATTISQRSYHPIHIVYEDDDFVVCQKDVGILVHSDGTREHSLTDDVNGYYEQFSYPYPVIPVHRIDKDTSGLVIFAKHILALSYMSHLFEHHHIEKSYDVMVYGEVKEKKQVITSKIGKDRHSNKQRVTPEGKDAKTTLSLVSTDGITSKLNVQIDGGRKHQIRVHLASIGYPVIGDQLYGYRTNQRMMLHFRATKFVHPRTGKIIEISCNEVF